MTPAAARLVLRLALPPALAVLLGCNMTAGQVSSSRTPIDQLLLTQSLLLSLDQATIPLLPGDSVAIETAWPPTHLNFTGDSAFAATVLAFWFAQHGMVVGGDRPAYRVRVLLHAFGLEQNDVFFGVPPVQSLQAQAAMIRRGSLEGLPEERDRREVLKRYQQAQESLTNSAAA